MINNQPEASIMPAPENLALQIPGAPLATITPLDGSGTTTQPEELAPVFAAKHNGGGRWRIWQTLPDGGADWFSDFVAVGDGAKEQAEAEASRLAAGDAPLVLDPERLADKAALATPAPAPAAKAVDATTIKQAVMTPEGWLCPEPPAAKE
ncbi:hypothetical protein KTQ74_07845 [Pseudomonas chlororaphis]|uniref:hypothetical protein n=1 Tax=Pseudomonas chlororaphis TaxID=587753 RepID=UPI001E36C269|nr:hypothetical protein [Pseudomonas chlororaphis]MCB2251801.1 hypothetical protein [Pseudomonas chlororaphis]